MLSAYFSLLCRALHQVCPCPSCRTPLLCRAFYADMAADLADSLRTPPELCGIHGGLWIVEDVLAQADLVD